jgi:tetratricopeptide (TPR) repeat protein
MRWEYLAAALAVALAAPAGAAVSVFAGAEAEACSHAALAGKSDPDSIKLCDQSLEGEILSPTDRAGTYINRGVMKLRRGAFEEARADFDAGIGLAPQVGEGWINRGAVFVGEKRYRDGLGDLDRGLALGVKEPEKAYYNRGLAHEGLDDETAAYLDYQQALTLKPDWDLPRHELLRFTVTRR